MEISLQRFLPKKRELKINTQDDIPVICQGCKNENLRSDLNKNLYVCPVCGYHYKIGGYYRLNTILDSGSFKESNRHLVGGNPLDFPGYQQKIDDLQKTTSMSEAVVTGKGLINGHKVVVAVLDSRFMMGSMGVAVGEKVTRAVEHATRWKLPLIIFSASGGARMQEGIYSLMQMAKTSAAIQKHSDEGLLYISVLTNPTMGGVTASFASLGDIILAEPEAMIGFAGPRVIEQTIRQKLPEGFQTAEYLVQHGFVDSIVERKDLRGTLALLLDMHKKG